MKLDVKKIWVRPGKNTKGKDYKVRLPHSINSGQLMPDEGCLVPETSYWMRRLKSGDVVKGKGKAKPDPKTTAKAAAPASAKKG